MTMTKNKYVTSAQKTIHEVKNNIMTLKQYHRLWDQKQ